MRWVHPLLVAGGLGLAFSFAPIDRIEQHDGWFVLGCVLALMDALGTPGVPRRSWQESLAGRPIARGVNIAASLAIAAAAGYLLHLYLPALNVTHHYTLQTVVLLGLMLYCVIGSLVAIVKMLPGREKLGPGPGGC